MQICPGLHTAYKTFWARLVLSIGLLLRRTLVRLAPDSATTGNAQAISATKTGSETPAFSNVLQYKCATQEAMPCNT